MTHMTDDDMWRMIGHMLRGYRADFTKLELSDSHFSSLEFCKKSTEFRVCHSEIVNILLGFLIVNYIKNKCNN